MLTLLPRTNGIFSSLGIRNLVDAIENISNPKTNLLNLSKSTVQLLTIFFLLLASGCALFNPLSAGVAGIWAPRHDIRIDDARLGPDKNKETLLLNASAHGSERSLKKTKSQMLTTFTGGVLSALGLAIFFVWITFSIFGTNGLLSVRGKKGYIPSQYRKAHRNIMKQLAKPKVAGSLPLGIRLEWSCWCPWEQKELAIPPEVRSKDPHALLLGISDKGKTRCMAGMVAHDIESNERAIVVIDSNGALVDALTRWIASHPEGNRISKRVIYLDPTSKNGKLSFNPLSVPPDGDLQGAATALVDGFKAVYTESPGTQSQWNAQTANILRNAALLLMVNNRTLTDLPTLLQDNDFRDAMLQNVSQQKNRGAEYVSMLATWEQYKKLARTEQWINWVEPILNRIGPMLSDPRIRPILNSVRGNFDFVDLLEGKKILLVKLPKGRLDENANLLGGLLVTGLKNGAAILAARGRTKHSGLYLDEFDNYIGQETLDSITRETDRFKIGFVGAIKTLQLLPEDFRNMMTIAVGTVLCFAVTKKDGDLFGPQMFRVDGRKIKFQTISNFFNPINTSPQFEYISDEGILNIDRLVGQNDRNFFCYRVGSQAGVFHLRAHDFNDAEKNEVNWRLIEQIKSNSGISGCEVRTPIRRARDLVSC